MPRTECHENGLNLNPFGIFLFMHNDKIKILRSTSLRANKNSKKKVF